MFPYVVSISITDSTGSDKQLFHTDLYNYMPYFSAGMPDIKILLLAVPAHILPQAVPRHTADNYILPRNLPAIPFGSFHWNIIHSMNQRVRAAERCVFGSAL